MSAQASTQQNQLLMFSVAMVASIVTAVTASTLIIMALLNGSAANAQSIQPVTQTGASVCSDPSIHTPTAATSGSETADTGTKLAAAGTYSSPTYKLLGSMSGSFNTTNTSSISNSWVTHTTTTRTTIRDNGNTFAPVYAPRTTTIQDNGNTYTDNRNSGNSTTTTTNTVNDNSDNRVIIRDNGNTNNQNNGNTTVANSGNTNNQNNGNTSVSNSGNTVVDDHSNNSVNTQVNVIDNDGVDVL